MGGLRGAPILIPFLLLLSNCLIFHSVSAWNVTFVVCMSYTSLAYSYDYYGPAIDMALKDLTSDYPEIAFHKVNLSPKTIRSCPELDMEILSLITHYLYDNATGIGQWNDETNLIVIIGNGCSDSLRYVADLAREIQIPVISSGGSGAVLQNSIRFPTLFRLLPYQQDDLVRTLMLFLAKYSWTDISLLCDNNPGLGNFFTLACQGFEGAFIGTFGMNSVSYKFNTQTAVDFKQILKMGSLRSRVFVIVAHGKKTRDIVVIANGLGMTNGDYVFITTYPMEHPLYGSYKWQFNDEVDDIAKQAFQSLYFVSTHPIRGPNYVDFEVELKYRAYKDYGYLYLPDEEVSSFTALQHTVVTFTGQIIWETVRETNWIKNGTAVMAKALESRNVSSVTGDFRIKNGDRVQYVYVIVGMDHRRYTFKEYYQYDTTIRNLTAVVTPVTFAYRPDGSSPPNKPFCDFDGSSSRCDNSATITIGIIVGLVGVLVLLFIPGYFIAKRLKPVEADDAKWYVVMDDLIQNNAATSGTTQGSSTHTNRFPHHGSHLNSQTRSEISVARSHTRTKTTSVVYSHSITKNSHVAKYRDKHVWMRKITLSHKFSPSSAQEILIRKMKRIHNVNLAHFYGLAPHELEMIVLCEVAPRGSLYDVMNNETIKFDTALKTSIVADITTGMVYLHDTHAGYHGDLSCHTCLMDGRFVVKLAYFRLDFLPRVTPDFLEGDAAYRNFLTFPPEQLRGPIAQIYRGSKEGDVYSYGHVIAQVCTEMEPFEREMQENSPSPKDVLDKIIAVRVIPLRPSLPNVEACPRKMAELIEKCWQDKPTFRPNFRTVEKMLKNIPGFQSEHNFVDTLFQRMAAYAEELENRINIATAGLMEEKKKSEDLLFQVLPRHLALALTQGKKIEPELFETVTIGFTALANFGEIAVQSSPMQIVDLLNDLYSMFDATLELFDVYKVETISDSYLIASGLPVRNGEEHSRQVAKVALELMRESANFKIRHRPQDILQLKVGFHQGKCAAGIVGLKMPRYCLFGDTINTASRMVSFGLPLKIQVSSAAMEHLKRFDEFHFQYRGLVEIKGKGQQRCYWLLQENELGEDLNDHEVNSLPGS